jgi:hypothetical protein
VGNMASAVAAATAAWAAVEADRVWRLAGDVLTGDLRAGDFAGDFAGDLAGDFSRWDWSTAAGISFY